MKKLLLTLSLTLLVSGMSAFGQGWITLALIGSGVSVSHVYGPEASDSSIIKSGNTSAETPAGTQVYGNTVRVQGTGYTAQLWGAPTGNPLVAQTPTSSFRTATSGTGGTLGPTLQVVTFSNAGAVPTDMLVRVWENRGGTITSWSQVLADTSILRGESNPVTITLKVAPTPADTFIAGIRSFNIHTDVPEPSAIALGVLGVGALVLFRRRKTA